MPPTDHLRTLSPTSSFPSIKDTAPLDSTDSYLSLADFLSESHTARLPSTRPSAGPSSSGSTSTRSNIDSILTRCSSVASKRAFNRRLQQTDLAYRTRGAHSPIAREVMVEASGELRETHDALMKCLHATEEWGGEIREVSGEKEPREERGYRWRPSEVELRRASGRATYGREEKEEKRRDGIGCEASEQTAVQMRGGGVQGLFGLKRKPSDAKGLPPRPEIISRPSDAFDQTPGSEGATAIPNSNRLEDLNKVAPGGPRDSRLLRVQQMEKLAPPSLLSIDGSSSLAGSGKTASIVPEGTIASFYMGSQTRPGTLHAPPSSRESRVSPSSFPSPPPSGPGGQSNLIPRVPSPARSVRSDSTIRDTSSLAELPSTELQMKWNSDDPTFHSSVKLSHEQAVGELLAVEMRGEPGTVRILGSPMQSPIRDNWGGLDRSPSPPSSQSEWQPPSSGYIKDPQTTFFDPKTLGGLERSVEEENRRLSGQSQLAESPISPVDEQVAGPHVVPPGSALSSDMAPLPHSPATTETMKVLPSNRSVWQGEGHLSIAPEDSTSEVWAKEHPQTPKAPQSQIDKKTTLFPREALTEVGEGHETEGEAKEKSEERFRDEIRKVWSSYQTRMRMINQDSEKTPEEKAKASKEEHRILELLIGQASTDTGFEQLHAPWQKDEFVRNLFGVRSKTSRTPSILRKANKIMKWFLAVPDDPELKTWSSRRRGLQYPKLDTTSSSLQRRATNATSSQPSRSTTINGRSRHGRQQDEHVTLSPEQHQRLHFAPKPTVHAQALRQPSLETLGYSSQATSAQMKAGKANHGQSEASSETGWPTQSQAGGGR